MTQFAANSNLSAPINRWQAANRKVLLAERAVMASFHRALRKEEIEAEDPPGEYTVTIFGKNFHSRPLLTQMWASATGYEYRLKHQARRRSRATPRAALSSLSPAAWRSPHHSFHARPTCTSDVFSRDVSAERGTTHAVVVDDDHVSERRHSAPRRAQHVHVSDSDV